MSDIVITDPTGTQVLGGGDSSTATTATNGVTTTGQQATVIAEPVATTDANLATAATTEPASTPQDPMPMPTTAQAEPVIVESATPASETQQPVDLQAPNTNEIVTEPSPEPATITTEPVTPTAETVEPSAEVPTANTETISLATAGSDELANIAAKFDIPQVVRDNHSELLELILVTKSMNDDERQYWFNILPIMSDEQVEKLRKILITEQRKLAEINQEYNARVTEINEKYLQKWQEKEVERKREELKKAEANAEIEDKNIEDNLLSQLNNL